MSNRVDFRPNKLAPLAAKANITVAQLVMRAVQDAGSVAGAARALQVNRNTVAYHLGKAGQKAVYRATLEEVKS